MIYEPTDEDADDVLVPLEEAQPDHFCDCHPGVELRHRWQHAPDCLRWAPPLTGPGSTPQHRAAALAHMRSVIADARRRNQAAS